MKKAFIGLLILILSAWAQYVFSAEPIQLARMNPYVAGGAADCTYPAAFSYATGNDYNHRLVQSYTSGSFTTVAAINGVVQICAQLRQVGTAPAVNITMYLNEDAEGAPGDVLQTSTNTKSAQTISSDASGELVCLDIASTNLYATTRYWITISSASTDASNAIFTLNNDGGSPTEKVYNGSTNPPTTTVDSSMSMFLAVKTCN